MKPALRAAALLLPAAALAANPRSISITMQETGRAQISETHDVPPPAADRLARIAPLPETLLPASVNLLPLERGQTIDVLSQRFAFDLRDSESLFRAYLGRPVTARRAGASYAGRLAALPDFSSDAPALMLAAEGQPARLLPNLRDVEAVEFPARADLARTPTLLWQTPADQAPPAAVQVHYAADGLSWSASHEAILSPDGRSMALSTRVLLSNRTTREFANARIRLALSDKGVHAPLVPEPRDPRAGGRAPPRFAPDGQSWIPERSVAAFSTVATYDLPNPVTLPPGEDVRAGLAVSDSVPVETRHVYDGVRFDRYQRNRRTDWNLGTESSPAVETRIAFRNPAAAPLPPGEFRLLRGAADRALEWIGHDWLPPLRPNEEAALHLGPAAGLSGRRVRTAYSEVVPFKVSEESFEIAIDNQSGADATVAVVEHLYRGENHEIIAASFEHSPGPSPHSIQFSVPVKNGTQRIVTYTVRYTW